MLLVENCLRKSPCFRLPLQTENGCPICEWRRGCQGLFETGPMERWSRAFVVVLEWFRTMVGRSKVHDAVYRVYNLHHETLNRNYLGLITGF